VWLSAEPVSTDLTAVMDEQHSLDWAVVGAASSGRRYFQPDAEHIRRLLELMDATKTPVFYKGNIKPLFTSHDFGSDELNRWREDFPSCYRCGELIAAVVRRQAECRQNGWPLSHDFSRSVARRHIAG